MDWENRSAFVFIKAYPGMAEELYEKIQRASNLFCVFMTTGAYDMVAWIDTAGIGDAYNWICEVRSWPQVERTSCCPTYHGHWNEESFRNANYHAWMKIRSTDLNSPFEYTSTRETAAFAASIPGEFDCIAMFCCEDLVGVYEEVKRLRENGYEIEYFTAFQTFWSRGCENIWQSYSHSAAVQAAS